MRLDLPPDLEERAEVIVGATMARWRAASEDDRDDLRLAAFLAAWQAARTWDPARGAALESWIIGGVRNAIRMEARRIAPIPRSQQRQIDLRGESVPPSCLPPVSLDAMLHGDGDDLDRLGALVGGEDPEERALTLDRERRVRRAVACLNPRTREMVVRYYWGGETYAQIAAALRCSKENVRVRLFRARERLALILARDREEGVI